VRAMRCRICFRSTCMVGTAAERVTACIRGRSNWEELAGGDAILFGLVHGLGTRAIRHDCFAIGRASRIRGSDGTASRTARAVGCVTAR
jgi:hypothetical protein